ISQHNSTPQPVRFHRGCPPAHLRSLTRTETQHFVSVIIPDTFNTGEFNNVLPNNETRPGTTHTNLRSANTQERCERFPGPFVLHPVIKRCVLGEVFNFLTAIIRLIPGKNVWPGLEFDLFTVAGFE